MRAIFRNHCGSLYRGSTISPNLNMHCNPGSIFNYTGNFGCGCNNGFFSNLGFGFGFGLGMGFGNLFNNFGNFGMFSNWLPFNFGSGLMQSYTSNFFAYPNSSTGFGNHSSINSSNNFEKTAISNSDKYLQKTQSKNVEQSKYSEENSSAKPQDASEQKVIDVSKPESKKLTKREIEKQKFDSLPIEVKDDMERIAKESLKKYLKNGFLAIKDIPIQTVPIKIKKVDFSGCYDCTKKGIKNDYRNNNGDIVRVADGTVITIDFIYNNQTYKIQLEKDKLPKKGEKPTTIQENKITITYEEEKIIN